MTVHQEDITQRWHSADQWEEWPHELDERESYLESARPARRLSDEEHNELVAIGKARERFEEGQARLRRYQAYATFGNLPIHDKLNWIFRLLLDERDVR